MASNQSTSPSGYLKRKRNEDDWQRNKAKRQRDSGQEYVSCKTGKTVAKRAVLGPCPCQKKCFEVVGLDNVNLIHTQFWECGDWNLQVAFVQRHSEQNQVKRRRTLDETKQRSGNWTYHVSVGGEKIVVCRQALANILGVPPGYINRCNERLTSGGVQIPDGRGKHGNHYTIPDEKKDLVEEHIVGIPKVTSHYSRRSSPNVLYLQESVNSMSDLYNLYKEWLDSNNNSDQVVTKHFYEDYIHTEHGNVKLSKPKSDTCKICDIFRLKTSDPGLSEEARCGLTTAQNDHIAKAEKGYDLTKTWVAEAGDDTWVIVVDLQAALPTPKISSNFAFYKRKLWTFNFGIHDLKTGRSYMFVWDEVTARRGAIEICSCIFKFVTTVVPSTVKKLIIISDNCPGQNKNFFIVMFHLYLVHCGLFNEIIHMFLRPGHTYNAADRDFACIEATLRTQQRILDIYDYISLIQKARTRKPFMVTKMEQSDFYDFPQLKLMCVRRPTPTGVKFSDACWFRFTEAYREGYELATDYTQLTVGGYKVKLSPKRIKNVDFKLNNMAMTSRIKYNAPLKLKQEKINDLRCLVKACAGPDSMNRYWNRILNVGPSGETTHDDDSYDDGDTGALGDFFDY